LIDPQGIAVEGEGHLAAHLLQNLLLGDGGVRRYRYRDIKFLCLFVLLIVVGSGCWSGVWGRSEAISLASTEREQLWLNTDFSKATGELVGYFSCVRVYLGRKKWRQNGETHGQL